MNVVEVKLHDYENIFRQMNVIVSKYRWMK